MEKPTLTESEFQNRIHIIISWYNGSIVLMKLKDEKDSSWTEVKAINHNWDFLSFNYKVV